MYELLLSQNHLLSFFLLSSSPFLTVIWRFFSQTVVFLYLMDEKTSLLILIPAGIATVIEVCMCMCFTDLDVE